MPYIRSATFEEFSNVLTVEFDGEKTTPDELEEDLSKAGYIIDRVSPDTLAGPSLFSPE